MSDEGQRFEVKGGVGDHFAWLRTQMAMQRTLMAAARTSVSLIGFGFTVAQFFQKLQVGGARARLGPQAPRDFGLVLIAAGVLSIAVFTWQYRQGTIYLKSGPYAAIAGVFEGRPMHSAAYASSWVIMLIGAAAFALVLARF